MTLIVGFFYIWTVKAKEEIFIKKNPKNSLLGSMSCPDGQNAKKEKNNTKMQPSRLKLTLHSSQMFTCP